LWLLWLWLHFLPDFFDEIECHHEFGVLFQVIPWTGKQGGASHPLRIFLTAKPNLNVVMQRWMRKDTGKRNLKQLLLEDLS
jgi:hypothetical protein